MFDLDIFAKFYDYLDWANNEPEKKPTAQLGLIKNAPKEAIEAYEIYKKWSREQEPEE